jgi:hypothetical protein
MDNIESTKYMESMEYMVEHFERSIINEYIQIDRFGVYVDDNGYIYGNWKIEPFVGFKITMLDGTQFILTKPEEFKEFGITLFEHSTSEFEPENDCNV